VLLPELLPFVMQTDSFNQHSIRESKGSVNPYVNFSDLAWYEFALPPIQEQARFVEGLVAAQVYAENLSALVESTRVAQLVAFDEMLKECNAKLTKIGGLLISSPRNGFSPTAASAPTGHWVLALSAISPWGYRFNQLKPVLLKPETLAAVINKGDLVISRSNTRELVGLPAVFPEDRSDVSYPDTMMRLTFDAREIDVVFIELCLRSPACRRQVQSFAAGTSTSMLKINGTNLKKVEIPLVGKSDQLRIVAEIDKFKNMIHHGEKRFNEARALQRHLSAAFSDHGGIDI
jgi:type I restriction enzyme, S subunit